MASTIFFLAVLYCRASRHPFPSTSAQKLNRTGTTRNKDFHSKTLPSSPNHHLLPSPRLFLVFRKPCAAPLLCEIGDVDALLLLLVRILPGARLLALLSHPFPALLQHVRQPRRRFLHVLRHRALLRPPGLPPVPPLCLKRSRHLLWLLLVIRQLPRSCGADAGKLPGSTR